MRLEKPEWLTLSALILDACGGEAAPLDLAEALVNRLDLGAAALAEITLLVGERELMRALANRPDALDEPRVLQFATHVERPERATALYLLTLADGGLDTVAEIRLHELYERVRASLLRPELTGAATLTALDERRAAVADLAGDNVAVAARAQTGPRTWLLQHAPDALVRQARLLEPRPERGRVRVQVTYDESEYAVIDVAGSDQPGFLAAVTGALAARGINVEAASAATWPDGAVIESFVVHRLSPARVDDLETEIAFQLRSEPVPKPIRGVRVDFDDVASPWTTIVDVEALDEPGLLHRLAAAFTASGTDVRSAQISSDGKLARDRFEVTDDRGEKLNEAAKERFRAALEGIVMSSRRGVLRRRPKVATRSKQPRDERETTAS
jgi:[protein-PII] uridylyltransferase